MIDKRLIAEQERLSLLYRLLSKLRCLFSHMKRLERPVSFRLVARFITSRLNTQLNPLARMNFRGILFLSGDSIETASDSYANAYRHNLPSSPVLRSLDEYTFRLSRINYCKHLYPTVSLSPQIRGHVGVWILSMRKYRWV